MRGQERHPVQDKISSESQEEAEALLTYLEVIITTELFAAVLEFAAEVVVDEWSVDLFQILIIIGISRRGGVGERSANVRKCRARRRRTGSSGHRGDRVWEGPHLLDPR